MQNDSEDVWGAVYLQAIQYKNVIRRWLAQVQALGPMGTRWDPALNLCPRDIVKMHDAEITLVAFVGVVFLNSLKSFKNQLKINKFQPKRLLHLHKKILLHLKLSLKQPN